MEPQAERISIWFFIGALVLVYGLLVLATGIYEVFVPPRAPAVLADLHAAIWWGALLLLIGGFYAYRFFPEKGNHGA